VGVIASTSEPAETAEPYGRTGPVGPPSTEPGEPTEPPQPTAPPAPSRRRRSARIAPRRSRVVVRRFDPWSVLKFSLLFYFCLMLVVTFALMILFWIMGVTGVLDSLGRILQNAGFGPEVGKGTFRFDSVWIFERMFALGGINVVVWSLVNLFGALLYNLVSDVVGGISITLTEKR